MPALFSLRDGTCYRDWDALPLAAREMCQLFPSLWATPQAAERWLEKEPLDAHRDIIRVWGLLHEYRPPGQTSWSKAMVRHGADPGVALVEGWGERRGHSGEGLSRLGDLRAPPSYPKATFGSAHQRQQMATMGGYLPLAPGVSSVRYPIRQRTFKYVAAVQSVTERRAKMGPRITCDGRAEADRHVRRLPGRTPILRCCHSV